MQNPVSTAHSIEGASSHADFMSPVVRIRSATPGRVRFDVSMLLDQSERANWVAHRLRSHTQIVSVAANPLTGRVLVKYDSPLELRELQTLVVQAVREILQPREAGERVITLSPDGIPISDETITPAAPSNPLVRILSRHPEHKSLAVRTVAFSFLNRLFDAGPTAMIACGVDIVTRRSSSFLGRLGVRHPGVQLLVLGGLGLFSWAADSWLNYLFTVASSDLRNAVQRDLINDVYQHLQTLDIATLQQRSISDWMGLFETDIGRVSEFILLGIDPIVTMAANAVVVGFTFLTQSPALAAIQICIRLSSAPCHTQLSPPCPCGEA